MKINLGQSQALNNSSKISIKRFKKYEKQIKINIHISQILR
ncbi:hypothetical protein pb186bvf_003200 [Paramecium bursaria]